MNHIEQPKRNLSQAVSEQLEHHLVVMEIIITLITSVRLDLIS